MLCTWLHAANEVAKQVSGCFFAFLLIALEIAVPWALNSFWDLSTEATAIETFQAWKDKYDMIR